jgi:hypothetical protein
MLPHGSIRGAEPQNLMPVGDSLANGCLFSGKKLLQQNGFPLPICNGGFAAKRVTQNQRKIPVYSGNSQNRRLVSAKTTQEEPLWQRNSKERLLFALRS